MNKFFGVLAIAAVCILVVGAYFSYKFLIQNRSFSRIKTYDECTKDLGSKIQESYPAVCITWGGKRFVQPVPSSTPNANEPQITSPTPNSIIRNPLIVVGTVLPDWMFEGSFPIRLVDKSGKTIATGIGKEDFPGSWQNGGPTEFTAKLSFTTNEKEGNLILESDNPSGDPAKLKTFEVPVLINCTPRPACLDATPRCLIPETADMCPTVAH